MALNPCDLFHGLQEHIGHTIEIVSYGDVLYPHTVAVECTTCMCVLMDYGDDDDEDDYDDEDEED